MVFYNINMYLYRVILLVNFLFSGSQTPTKLKYRLGTSWLLSFDVNFENFVRKR